MPSFDVHQHLWPPSVVDALRRRSKPPLLDGDTLVVGEGQFPFDAGAHDLDARLAALDTDGVDVAIVSLQPTLGLETAPEVVDAFHDGVAELVRGAGGRLRAFAAGRCLPGFTGACVPAQALLGGVEELAEQLRQAGQALFVHPGPCGPPPPGAPPWWSAVVDYTAQMQSAYAAWLVGAAERHPDLPVVFAVLAGGAPVQLERLRARGSSLHAASHSNVYFDTASYGARALGLCLDAYGSGQLLYGSDAPVVDPGPTARALAELGEDVVRAARVDNPTGIFG